MRVNFSPLKIFLYTATVLTLLLTVLVTLLWYQENGESYNANESVSVTDLLPVDNRRTLLTFIDNAAERVSRTMSTEKVNMPLQNGEITVVRGDSLYVLSEDIFIHYPSRGFGNSVPVVVFGEAYNPNEPTSFTDSLPIDNRVVLFSDGKVVSLSKQGCIRESFWDDDVPAERNVSCTIAIDVDDKPFVVRTDSIRGIISNTNTELFERGTGAGYQVVTVSENPLLIAILPTFEVYILQGKAVPERTIRPVIITNYGIVTFPFSGLDILKENTEEKNIGPVRISFKRDATTCLDGGIKAEIPPEEWGEYLAWRDSSGSGPTCDIRSDEVDYELALEFFPSTPNAEPKIITWVPSEKP